MNKKSIANAKQIPSIGEGRVGSKTTNQDSIKITSIKNSNELEEKTEKVKLSIKKQLPKVKRGLDSLFDVLSSKTQSFKINTRKSNFIEGKEGTIIFIPSSAFGTQKNVKITLKESYSKSSYLFNCLSTQTSKGENLATAGMIEVKAYTIDNKKLELSKGKEIKIQFPVNGKREKGFRLFNEVLSKDSIIEWKYNVNGSPTLIVKTITFHTGRELISYSTRNNKLGFLTKKEVEIIQRRMDASISNEFVLRTNKMVDSLLTYKKEWYENDLEFFKILKKVSDNLKGNHTKLLTKIKENSRVYFEFSDATDTLSNKEYNKRFKAFYAKNKNFEIKDWELQRYILNSNKLGWINCDKFYNDSRQKVNIHITKDKNNATYMLYLKEVNSAIRAVKSKTSYTLNNLPKGSLGTLLGIKYLGGKIYIAKKNIKVSSKPISKFKYKEIAIQNLADEINKSAIF